MRDLVGLPTAEPAELLSILDHKQPVRSPLAEMDINSIPPAGRTMFDLGLNRPSVLGVLAADTFLAREPKTPASTYISPRSIGITGLPRGVVVVQEEDGSHRLQFKVDPFSPANIARTQLTLTKLLAKSTSVKLVTAFDTPDAEPVAPPTPPASQGQVLDTASTMKLMIGLTSDQPLLSESARRRIEASYDAIQDHKREMITIAAAGVAAAVLATGTPKLEAPSRPTPIVAEAAPNSPKSAHKPVEVVLASSSKVINFIPSHPTHPFSVARLLGIDPQALTKANPKLNLKAEVPAGMPIRAEVSISKVPLQKPVTVGAAARAFGLTDDAIRSTNLLNDEGLVEGTLAVPRTIVALDQGARPNIGALAKTFNLSEDEARGLQYVNSHTPPGLLVLPNDSTLAQPATPVDLVLAAAHQPIAPLPEVPTTLVADSTTTTQAPFTQVTVPAEVPLETTTTTVPPAPVAAEVPAETPPSPPAPEAQPISPEEAAVNQAMGQVDINKQTNDISSLVFSVIALDKSFAPNDPDRRPDLPNGYVKMLLPNEAPGVSIFRTVAERTAGPERYTAPHGEAAMRAISAAFQQFIIQKYPQYAGAVVRLRDGNSPNHATHQFGRMIDFSTAMSLFVKQYSDGPVADRQFSTNYNRDFTIDMLLFMAGLRTGNDPVISQVVSSDRTVVNTVNAKLGIRFMVYDDDGEHNDHVHLILNKKFALPAWGLRARDLPWGTNQDLRVGSAARPISNEQHQNTHKGFELWMALQIMKATGQTIPTPAPAVPVAPVVAAQPEQPTLATPTPEATADSEPTASQKYHFAMEILLNEFTSHEAAIDIYNAFNHGQSGDAKGNYKLSDGRKITDLSLAEVMKLQQLPAGDPDKLYAVGFLQIIPPTLRGLVAKIGIDTNRKFDADTQKELFTNLIFTNRPRLGGYIKGQNNDLDGALQDACMEWASLPCNNGSSHYPGHKNVGGQPRVATIKALLMTCRLTYAGALQELAAAKPGA